MIPKSGFVVGEDSVEKPLRSRPPWVGAFDDMAAMLDHCLGSPIGKLATCPRRLSFAVGIPTTREIERGPDVRAVATRSVGGLVGVPGDTKSTNGAAV